MSARVLPPLSKIAEMLGGDVYQNKEVHCPGPGHSKTDRSLSVQPDKNNPDGFMVWSFSRDNLDDCRKHVLQKLGQPKVEDTANDKKRNDRSRPWTLISEHIYRDEQNEPYLLVRKFIDETGKKQYPQKHWDGHDWVSGAPKGPKMPYRLPQLIVAPLTTTILIAEGEKCCDSLAKRSFVATTNSEGAAGGKDDKSKKWTKELDGHFAGRHVVLIGDNDAPGRRHMNYVGKRLHKIAKSVRVLDLAKHWPGGNMPEGADVADFLEQHDRAGVRLGQLIREAPLWEPPSEEKPETTSDHTESIPLEEEHVKKKQADILIELASTAELFHDRNDVGYARFTVNGHQENAPLRSKSFKRWLVRAYYQNTKGAPSSEAMSAALGVLEARAMFDAPEHDVSVRVAGHNGSIYIDLADPNWRAIEIDEDGWRIVDNPVGVYFRRSSGMKSLPEPTTGGSINDDLKPLLNVKTDGDMVLVCAWLLAALRDHGPYPVLALTGEQGSAKTLLAKILRALVDPNSVPLRALPRNEHDVFIAARSSHVIAYDNTSGLPDWLSDTCCRLATGGGFSTRELYTDQEEVLFGSTRPILLNGIDDIVTRPDLADRSMVLTLASIPDRDRKLESDLWASFEQKYPRILGTLLSAVSHGLRALPGVRLNGSPRMADFATWITACEGALWEEGTFLSAYTDNIEQAVEMVLDAEQVATAVRAYMDLRTAFEGTAADLLKALNGVVPEAQQKARGWPKRPNTLTGILRRNAPPLRKVGVEVTFNRDSRRRWITIKRPGKVSKTSSLPSSPPLSQDTNGLGATEDRHQIVTGRDGDDPDDDACDDVVNDKPLKRKGYDDDDDHDDVFHTLARSPICAQCQTPPDGTEQRCAVNGETVWLHPACQHNYLERGGR